MAYDINLLSVSAGEFPRMFLKRQFEVPALAFIFAEFGVFSLDIIVLSAALSYYISF